MSVNVVWTTVMKMLTVLIQKAVTYAHAEKATVAMEEIAQVNFVVNYSNSHEIMCFQVPKERHQNNNPFVGIMHLFLCRH